jgi:hypothetical protein
MPMKPEEMRAIAKMVAEMMQEHTPAAKGRSADEVMVTLTARVPPEFIAFLDTLGPSRSEALRDILREARETRARKKA